MWWLLLLLLIPALGLFVFIKSKIFARENITISNKKASWLNKDQLQLSDGYNIFTESTFFENSAYIVIGVHGMGCSTKEFSYLKEFLSERKISFIAFDQRNFGKNKSFKYKKLPIVVEDIQEIVNLLVAQYGTDKKIVLIGESLGSAILSLCLKHIKPLYKAILVNFVTEFGLSAAVKTKWETFNFNSKLLLALMFKKTINMPTWCWSKWLVSDNKDLIKQYYSNLQASNDYTYNFIYLFHSLIFSKKIPTLLMQHQTTPILIVQSKCDIYLNWTKFETIKNAITTQNKNIAFHILPDQKHMLLSEPNREAVFNIITNWLIKE